MDAINIGAQMGPDYQIKLDDIDITSNFRSRLMGMTITDKRGMELDTFTMELDDSDGKIILPQRGSILQISIGWQGMALFDKGKFIIQTVTHTGSPDKLALSGFSADLSDVLKESRSESYDRMTLGEIVKRIAERNKLGASLPNNLATPHIEHLDQTNENDLQFLARLAVSYGAVATIKNGKVLLLIPGKGTTAKGDPLPEATIRRRDGDAHSFSYTGDMNNIGVKARWLRLDKANSGRVLVRAELDPPGTIFETAGSRYLELGTLFTTEEEAVNAATAEWKKNQRMSATLSFGLAMGRPELTPEMLIEVSGFKELIDKHKWIISSVAHTINSGGGFTSKVELEIVLKDSVVAKKELD